MPRAAPPSPEPTGQVNDEKIDLLCCLLCLGCKYHFLYRRKLVIMNFITMKLSCESSWPYRLRIWSWRTIEGEPN